MGQHPAPASMPPPPPCACSAKPRISNAADADVLQTFLRFGQAECPADRYVVSFFGHAAGPMGVFSDTVPGDVFHDTLRLPALVNAFKGCDEPGCGGRVPRLLHELPRGDLPAAGLHRVHRRDPGARARRRHLAVEGVHGLAHPRGLGLRGRPGPHQGAGGVSRRPGASLGFRRRALHLDRHECRRAGGDVPQRRWSRRSKRRGRTRRGRAPAPRRWKRHAWDRPRAPRCPATRRCSTCRRCADGWPP